ncbi:isocitrate lyase/PEP mutase family protein [Subtercola frigoramans]|uniref:2-methylisocitrate lyase-like PEP mutase family enzyme n=1 Tax=Subtercola frigoramans TaxID=120298 RepID=A0ABS2L9D2_9MICO|nr:isocitrate lyase/phosphoenolpyruvate mutase family protein [Subtercola frigoramans]MBM7473711.1 2-methylisocitrate lyase-like PEP mutase family enzyme [Subtercola frigoramans]
MSTPPIQTKADELLRLHLSPDILSVVNVWDAVSAKVIADIPETRALATASHSIAALFGYADGEQIPVDLMIDMVGRIAASTRLPVSADLEAGYGAPGETVRKAIGVGIVGANLEDQMKPFGEAVSAVAQVVAASQAEGIDFVLNARTDAFLRAGDRPHEVVVDDAITRGRAYLEAGASCVFVPGKLDAVTVERLVGGLGRQRVSVIGIPGSLSPSVFEELGVARISYGPWSQRVALTALADLAVTLYGNGSLPDNARALN